MGLSKCRVLKKIGRRLVPCHRKSRKNILAASLQGFQAGMVVACRQCVKGGRASH